MVVLLAEVFPMIRMGLQVLHRSWHLLERRHATVRSVSVLVRCLLVLVVFFAPIRDRLACPLPEHLVETSYVQLLFEQPSLWILVGQPEVQAVLR